MVFKKSVWRKLMQQWKTSNEGLIKILKDMKCEMFGMRNVFGADGILPAAHSVKFSLGRLVHYIYFDEVIDIRIIV